MTPLQAEFHDRFVILRRGGAGIDLYGGRISAAMAALTYTGVSRRHAADLPSRLPKGPIGDGRRMQLTRAANEIAGVKSNGTYTQWKLQEAIAKVATKEMKPKHLFPLFFLRGLRLMLKFLGYVCWPLCTRHFKDP